jgi:hypothetical protein
MCVALGCAKALRLPGVSVVEFDHDYYGPRRQLLCEGAPDLLFTENETNTQRLYGDADGGRYVKDSFQRRMSCRERRAAVNPDQVGSKAVGALCPVHVGRGSR